MGFLNSFICKLHSWIKVEELPSRKRYDEGLSLTFLRFNVQSRYRITFFLSICFKIRLLSLGTNITQSGVRRHTLETSHEVKNDS